MGAAAAPHPLDELTLESVNGLMRVWQLATVSVCVHT